MSLIRQSAQTLGWQVTGFLVLALSGMVTARYLGPADRGLLAAAYLYLQLASVLGSFSLGVAILHHYRQRNYSPDEFAGTCAAASAGLGLLTFGLLLTGIWMGGDALHRGIPLTVLIIVLLPLPFLFAQTLFASLLQVTMDIPWYNFVSHVPKLASLVVVMTLLSVGRLAVWELVIAGAIVTTLCGLIPIWRMHAHAKGPWRIRGRLFRQLLADGLQIHIGGVAAFLAARANLLLANAYLSKAEVGFLYVAITLAELVWFITVAAETVLYPQAAQMSSADAAVLTARVCRQILLLSIVSGLLLAAFAPAVVLLYGGRAFLPAVVPLRLLLPGVVALTISRILSALWIREGRFLTLGMVAGGTALLSVVLNIVLIPSFGTAGTALATTLPYLANAAVSLLMYRWWVSPDLTVLLRVERQDLVHLARSLMDLRPSAIQSNLKS